MLYYIGTECGPYLVPYSVSSPLYTIYILSFVPLPPPPPPAVLYSVYLFEELVGKANIESWLQDSRASTLIVKGIKGTMQRN